jgi:uncharacterized protein YutE (UPF0331/DUF86 family)
MASVYNGIVEKKISALESKLAELRSWPIESVDSIKNSSLLQNAIERSLQICVEVVIDIAERILSVEKRTPSETSFGNLQILEALGGVASAEKYRMMIQFRNFIVHRYENVDPGILFEIVKNKLPLFEEFIAEIRDFTAKS